MMNRLALLYSDGSMGILSDGATEKSAREDAMFADANETDPAKMTKVVRVRLEITETLVEPKAPRRREGVCACCQDAAGVH